MLTLRVFYALKFSEELANLLTKCFELSYGHFIKLFSPLILENKEYRSFFNGSQIGKALKTLLGSVFMQGTLI